MKVFKVSMQIETELTNDDKHLFTTEHIYFNSGQNNFISLACMTKKTLLLNT